MFRSLSSSPTANKTAIQKAERLAISPLNFKARKKFMAPTHLELLHNSIKIDAHLGQQDKTIFDKNGKKVGKLATDEATKPTAELPNLAVGGQSSLPIEDDPHGGNNNNRKVAQRVAREAEALAKDQSGAPKADVTQAANLAAKKETAEKERKAKEATDKAERQKLLDAAQIATDNAKAKEAADKAGTALAPPSF